MYGDKTSKQCLECSEFLPLMLSVNNVERERERN